MDEFLPAGFGLVFSDDDENKILHNMFKDDKYPLVRISNKHNELFEYSMHMAANNEELKNRKLVAVWITYYCRREYEC